MFLKVTQTMLRLDVDMSLVDILHKNEEGFVDEAASNKVLGYTKQVSFRFAVRSYTVRN